MQLKQLLEHMVEHKASDLYLTVGAAPAMKIDGRLVMLDIPKYMPGTIHQLALTLMTDDQKMEFKQRAEMNMSLSMNGIGRFRVNIFQQRNETAMVVRYIKSTIPEIEELGIPEILKTLIMEKRGLMLFVGATGAGKSTTLAALINYRNKNSAGHIVTIEDPIEYIHRHNRSIVNQREVGIDTDTYEIALKNTLRQAPDMIYIGEIRDVETMKHAIAFSETGHLCVSTLHASNANQAIERVLNLFPLDKRTQILYDLSLNLIAVISQRLIPTRDGVRTAVFEIMIVTPLIKDLIIRGEIHRLKEVMEQSEDVSGMQTFDMSLQRLYEKNIITLEDALQNADSRNNLKIRISLKSGRMIKSNPDLNLRLE